MVVFEFLMYSRLTSTLLCSLVFLSPTSPVWGSQACATLPNKAQFDLWVHLFSENFAWNFPLTHYFKFAKISPTHHPTASRLVLCSFRVCPSPLFGSQLEQLTTLCDCPAFCSFFLQDPTLHKSGDAARPHVSFPEPLFVPISYQRSSKFLSWPIICL